MRKQRTMGVSKSIAAEALYQHLVERDGEKCRKCGKRPPFTRLIMVSRNRRIVKDPDKRTLALFCQSHATQFRNEM